jgi:hypothetical protein
MSLVALAYFLAHKYAQDLSQPDVSLGKPITPEKTKILKDKLSQLAEYITNLPEFKQAEQEFAEADDYLFEGLKYSLEMYSAAVQSQNLRENFQFFIKVIMKLNRIREGLSKKYAKAKGNHWVYNLDAILKRVQDYIWENSKAILNLHDLRGIDLTKLMLGTAMTLKERIIPTWHYGPMKNPAKPLAKKPHPYAERIKDIAKQTEELMKRLEQENEMEAKQRKGEKQ